MNATENELKGISPFTLLKLINIGCELAITALQNKMAITALQNKIGSLFNPSRLDTGQREKIKLITFSHFSVVPQEVL